MPLLITDEQLRVMQMDEVNARIEIACRLFDAGKIGFHAAMRLAGLERVAFEDELAERNIAIYRPTIGDLHNDLKTLDKLGQ
jgi:predicted HTH domain antitoxin